MLYRNSNVNYKDISITTTSSQIIFNEDIKIKPTFNLYSEYEVNHDNSEIIYNTDVNEDNWLQYEEGANIQCPDSNVIGYAYQIEISEGNIYNYSAYSYSYVWKVINIDDVIVIYNTIKWK